jgi:hypothetical protein
MSHINFEASLGYLENQLSNADRIRVEQHLSQPCQKCNLQISRLRSFLALTGKGGTFAPSAEVLQRAVAIHKQRLPAPLSLRERILAALQFDSRLQLSPSASRGAARTRQMLYTTSQVDIDLQLTPDHGEHNLVGQILSDVPAQAFVSLQGKDGSVIKGIGTDAQGQFAFKNVFPGVYDLLVETDQQEIAILDLELVND